MMRASYHRENDPHSREYTINQRALTFVGAVIALLGSVFSVGISYGVMQVQLKHKLDSEIHREDIRGVDRRIARDSSLIRFHTDELSALKESVQRTERRVTDIACDLIIPRRSYCR